MKPPPGEIEKPVAGGILACFGVAVVIAAFYVWRAGINVLSGEVMYNIGAGLLLIAGAFLLGLSAVLFSLTQITNYLALIASKGEPTKPDSDKKKPDETIPKKEAVALKPPPKEPSVYKI